MHKASLVGTFVHDHCVLHVIPCVRDNCNHSVGSLRALGEIVVGVILSPHERGLREKDSVHLVVHSVWMIVVWGSHRLLGHLALIHVSRRLVIVRKWDRRSNYRKHVYWVKLLMGGV